MRIIRSAIASALVGVCGAMQAHSQDIVITALDSNGRLSWSNSASAGYQSIQWAPSLTGDWERLTYASCAGSAYTAAVPMFYRVLWSPGWRVGDLEGTWTNTGSIMSMNFTNTWTFDANGYLVGFVWTNGPPLLSFGGQLKVLSSGGVTGTVYAVHASQYGDETYFFTWNGQFESRNAITGTVSGTWMNPGGGGSGYIGTYSQGPTTK